MSGSPIFFQLPECGFDGTGQVAMRKFRVQHLGEECASNTNHPGLDIIGQFFLLGGGLIKQKMLSVPLPESVALRQPLFGLSENNPL